jgi:hypothetical protein
MSFKTEIKVFNDPKFYPNGIAFETENEAEAYGSYKMGTWWPRSHAYRVVESTEPVNYRWDNAVGLVDVTAEAAL